MYYEKSREYIESIFNVCNILFNKSKQNQDRKLFFITKLISNYLLSITMEKGVCLSLSELNKTGEINKQPIIEYIAKNEIKLYDLRNMQMTDMNVADLKDVERYVLSHIYYIITNN
jgi:hypothetical protein